ncbi:MAG: tail fiber domain-containing protein [Bradyrhizobium sp.]|uniref:tail fiber domain-containing protein n=1 Tax=Bradyrhizobium sp. TaxID=376 RepID=UPI00121C7063|nr:tail fiber domain-containing protein [Bradyrhizobium sp.]THD66226.1 MAG: tail fiber domain-containing protein [Bradyrhizobium sp.]
MADESKSPKIDQAIDGLDENKRKTLTRLVTGSAFVAPVVASFAMDGLSISKAVAQANGTGSALPPSDRRLKTDISRVGSLPSGLNLYRFRYVGHTVDYVGVMAQEAMEVAPQAVVTGAHGFLLVDYAALGTRMMTYADWESSRAA